MQIGDSNTVIERGNAGLSSKARRSMTGPDLAAQEASIGDETDEAGAAVEPLEAASQDSAVNISAAGAAAASSDTGETSGGDAGDTPHPDTAQGGGDDQGDPVKVSPVKSFTYGALGLERPDMPKENSNETYTAGRWLAAGFTLGGIISLLV
jgi:hypothetical protein